MSKNKRTYVKNTCRRWHKIMWPKTKDSHAKMYVYWHYIVPLLFNIDEEFEWKTILNGLNKAPDDKIEKIAYYIAEYKNYGNA